MTLELTDQNFEQEVLQSDVPVLVDFHAEWCGPCKMQGPIIDELDKIYNGKGIKIAKLDVDAAPETAQKYRVMSIPTLIVFTAGEPGEPMVGLQDKKSLAEKIEELKK